MIIITIILINHLIGSLILDKIDKDKNIFNKVRKKTFTYFITVQLWFIPLTRYLINKK